MAAAAASVTANGEACTDANGTWAAAAPSHPR